MMYVLIVLAMSGGSVRSATTADFFTKEACEAAASDIGHARCYPKGNPLDMNADEIRKLLRPKS